jgi:hypothetical protein
LEGGGSPPLLARHAPTPIGDRPPHEHVILKTRLLRRKDLNPENAPKRSRVSFGLLIPDRLFSRHLPGSCSCSGRLLRRAKTKATASPPKGRATGERGSCGATLRDVGRKPKGRAGASQRAGAGWLDGGVSLVSDLSDSSGYTKRVQAGGEVPHPNRGTPARIRTCTVKMRGEECGDLRFF